MKETDPEANPDQALQSLFDEFWHYTLHEHPLQATRFGAHHYDDRLPEKDPEAYERRFEKESDFLSRLREVPREAASPTYQQNYDLFERLLKWSLREYELNTRYLEFNKLFGFHVTLPQIQLQVPLETVKNFEDYTARLEAVPRFVRDHIELLSEGVEKGVVPAANALRGVDEQLQSLISPRPEESPFFGPFHEMPEWIPASDRDALTERAREVLSTSVNDAFGEFLEFYRDTYRTAARDRTSCEALPKGAELYRFLIDRHTTTNLTPEEIHEIGREDVRRIRRQMEEVKDETGFDGDLQSFVSSLRNDERFYFEDPDELVRAYRDICKRMDARLPSLFGHLPRAEYGVRPIPEGSAEDAPAAYYLQPAVDGSHPGWFMVNTSNLSSRPSFEMEALALHEAVPGHHLQISLQQEASGLADFRRLASFMAYTEGWGLYAERLGREAGFYRDPYSEFGRLSFAIWRAARLVVDTGLHHMDWDPSEARTYLTEQTALTEKNIQSEVDRYIAKPAQALSYRIGERKILELRTRAERELGDAFSIRGFHDHLLGAGSLPLDLLDDRMRSWIDTHADRSGEEE